MTLTNQCIRMTEGFESSIGLYRAVLPCIYIYTHRNNITGEFSMRIIGLYLLWLLNVINRLPISIHPHARWGEMKTDKENPWTTEIDHVCYWISISGCQSWSTPIWWVEGLIVDGDFRKWNVIVCFDVRGSSLLRVQATNLHIEPTGEFDLQQCGSGTKKDRIHRQHIIWVIITTSLFSLIIIIVSKGNHPQDSLISGLWIIKIYPDIWYVSLQHFTTISINYGLHIGIPWYQFNYSQRHASEEHYRTKSLDDAETPMESVTMP